MLMLLLLACGPQTADDCLPTFGDNCSCERQCMTEQQLRWAQYPGVCDMACTSEEWTCEVEAGQCVVVE